MLTVLNQEKWTKDRVGSQKLRSKGLFNVWEGAQSHHLECESSRPTAMPFSTCHTGKDHRCAPARVVREEGKRTPSRIAVGRKTGTASPGRQFGNVRPNHRYRPPITPRLHRQAFSLPFQLPGLQNGLCTRISTAQLTSVARD